MKQKSLKQIACIGGAHYDEKLVPLVRLGPQEVDPMRRTFGGVIRNVAENLARLGVRVELISRIGNDERGEQLLAALKGLNIGTDGVLFSDTLPTATYSAILDSEGEIFAASSYLQIYDEITPKMLQEASRKVASCDFWVVDGNFSKECLYQLTKERPAHVEFWGMATSISKVHQWEKALPYIDVFILNSGELEALERDAEDLLNLGIRKVIVTKGDKGLDAFTREGMISLPALPAKVVDVTGAGDALAAGVLFGCIEGYSFEKSLHLGLKSASLTIQSEYAVLPHLSAELLLSL